MLETRSDDNRLFMPLLFNDVLKQAIKNIHAENIDYLMTHCFRLKNLLSGVRPSADLVKINRITFAPKHVVPRELWEKIFQVFQLNSLDQHKQTKDLARIMSKHLSKKDKGEFILSLQEEGLEKSEALFSGYKQTFIKYSWHKALYRFQSLNFLGITPDFNTLVFDLFFVPISKTNSDNDTTVTSTALNMERFREKIKSSTFLHSFKETIAEQESNILQKIASENNTDNSKYLYYRTVIERIKNIVIHEDGSFRDGHTIFSKRGFNELARWFGAVERMTIEDNEINLFLYYYKKYEQEYTHSERLGHLYKNKTNFISCTIISDSAPHIVHQRYVKEFLDPWAFNQTDPVFLYFDEPSAEKTTAEYYLDTDIPKDLLLEGV